MRIGYFDLIGGASGDMLLGALADAGVPQETLQQAVAALKLPGVELRFERVNKAYLSALQATITAPRQEAHRHLPDLLEKVEQSGLERRFKERIARVIQRLAQVEAGIHGMPVEEIHLHELGGDDTLADIAACLVGIEALGLDEVIVSPVPLARGWTKSAHGPLPLPAPATLALLKGVPLRPVEEVEAELVTPTGAVLLTEIAARFGLFPPLTLERVGLGAGRRELPFPNVLRLWVGEADGRPEGEVVETLTVLEANLDDQSPQVHGYVMERLFAAGALDVTLTPLQMKKNRPGILLSVLCRPETASSLLQILWAETTTLGVRRRSVERVSLPRRFQEVETEFGLIRMKVVRWEGGERAAAEYEDCRRAAQGCGVPLARVIEAANRAYHNLQGGS